MYKLHLKQSTSIAFTKIKNTTRISMISEINKIDPPENTILLLHISI